MDFTEQSLGTKAAFLLPSLKLKGQREAGKAFEQEVHDFLLAHFDGYTAAAGNLFGYWKDRNGKDSYGEHREFTVALMKDTQLPLLKGFLARLAREIKEDCIYLETGQTVTLIYGQST